MPCIEVQISDERKSQEPKLSQIRSKQPYLLGPLDRMIDSGKLKQSTLNEGERRKWLEFSR